MDKRVLPLVVLFILAGTLAAGLTAGTQRGGLDGPIDLIIHNAKVFTGASQTVEEALAVRGNEIVRVGSNREIRRLGHRETRMIDARGSTVLPGFIDAHTHFIGGGLAMDRVSLLDAETLEAIRKKIRAFAAANPDRPWVLGRGWYYSPFPDGLPTRQQLDDLVPDRPAYMICYDGHTGWANSKALQLSGITRDTPDPKDGVIVKDPKTGEPTGILKESAMGLISKVLPPISREDRLRAIRDGVAEANRFGITSVHEAGTSESQLQLFEEARKAGDLKVRVYAALSGRDNMTDADADRFDALRQRYAADPMIRVGAIKVMADGVIEAHTAAMLAPYANRPGAGHANYTPESLQRLVTMMDRRGWQIMTHAIGDGAVRMTLDAYEKAAQANRAPARGRRHRIEHVETVDPADIPRFARLGVIVSYMPFHANPSPAQLDVWTANLGPERSARGWILKTFRESGARIALGSDWPVVSLDPRLEIHMAVNRTTPQGIPLGGWHGEERISLDAAIEGITADAAYASFDERRTGRLAAGMLADVVVLSKDIAASPSGRFLEAQVEVTLFDGKVVYQRPAIR